MRKLIVSLLALWGCSDSPIAEEPCPPPPAPSGGELFVDATSELGVDAEHHFGTDFCELTDTVGGPGVCLIDHDGDGDVDIFFTDRAGHPSHLYENRLGSFVDVGAATGAAQEASDTMGCLAFDYDGDGDTDLYLANNGDDQLLENDGGTFTDVTSTAGIVADGFSISATAGDVDADGDLDLFVARVVQLDTCPDRCFVFPAACEAERNLLFINEGGRFSEEAVARGIDHPAPTLAPMFFDFDGDDDVDLFVGNDMGIQFPDHLYINDGNGQFTDRAEAEGLNGPGTDTMGVDIGDLDLNGTTDLVISDFKDRPIRLYFCREPELPCSNEVAPGGADLVKWSVGLVDFDHDRDLDLFVSNGDVAEDEASGLVAENRNYLYFNQGSGNLVEQLPSAGSALATELNSRSAAFGDLDEDGDIDIVIATAGGGHQILLNEASAGFWLSVALDAGDLGARVSVTTETGRVTEHVVAGGTYAGNNDPRVHFGLADACRADVTVRYVDGTTQTLERVDANQVLRVGRNQNLATGM